MESLDTRKAFRMQTLEWLREQLDSTVQSDPDWVAVGAEYKKAVAGEPKREPGR